MKSLKPLLSLLAALSLIITGCDIAGSDSDGPSTVELQMKVQTSTQAKMTASSTDGASVNTAAIQEVKLFVDEMELESADEDSLDFEREAFIISLPLDGSSLTLTESEIPAGFYDEFELEIEKPESDENISDPDFRDETGSYSVVVKGLYNNEPFMFRSDEDFELELDLNPPLDISESDDALLVISVDVSDWFRGSDGTDLDPKDFANLETINENIENSFEAFEENNDDDDDDDEDEDDDDEDDDDDDN